LKKTDLITLGFKSVPRNGAAALVGCRAKDGALFLLGLWEKPANASPEWEVPVRSAVARVKKYMKQDRTRYLMADPWTIQDIVGRLAVDFEDQVEEFWLNQHLKQAKAVDQFEEAVYQGRVIHGGDFNLSRHILNAHTEEVTAGYILRKDRPHSTRYIVAAHAAVLAYEAMMTAREQGLLDDGPDSTLRGF
jgi:phage terminase large subunit-like protein